MISFNRAAVVLVCAAMINPLLAATAAPTPPAPEKIAHTRAIHGYTLSDPYFWLRERDNSKVMEHLKAENAYTDAVMAHTKDLQAKLYDEMLARIKQTDESVPYPRKGYWYSTKTQEGKPYPIFTRRKATIDGPEQVMLDVNETVKDLPNGSAGPVGISPDSRIMAFAVDPTGGRVSTIRFKVIDTGELLPDIIEGASGNMVFANDNKTIFFTTLDPAVRPDKAWRLVLGSGAKPTLVYHETDERFFVGVDKPLSEKFIFLSMSSQKTSEVRYLDADAPAGEFKPIEPRKQGVEYSVDHHGDQFFITHNEDAINFTLVSAPIDKPGKANWKTVIPHRADVLIQGTTSFKDHMIVTAREKGLPVLRVRSFAGSEYVIDTPEVSYTLGGSTNADYDTTKFRFAYSSPLTPSSIFEVDVKSKERKLLKEQPVLGGYDRTKYQVERVNARAKDGTDVPVTIVHRKGLARDGTAPALLEGYGSYGFSNDAGFSSAEISLLDRGFVLATAHIRGGSEKGRLWYEQGRLNNKKNTFSDFVAAADFLVSEKYTSTPHLAIRGGSAGGLLMGAVVNLRPELFKAVIADVPFVDVINTMLDPDLPLTVIEYEQWGNPNEKAPFDYIMSYSPYDNVKPAAYPDILTMVGFHDSNVPYWEGAKWAAKIRDAKTNDATVLVRCNLEAGHGGASDRYKRLREEAFRYAFLLDRLGVK